MSSVHKFSSNSSPFSNFYNFPVEYDGMCFRTSENAYQAAKTLDLKLRESFVDINPRQTKNKGRQLELRADWEEVKYSVMFEILKNKFSDSELRSVLLDTGDAEIVEDTTGWHDNIWGNCDCEKCRDIEGQNLLGKALMAVRGEMRSI